MSATLAQTSSPSARTAYAFDVEDVEYARHGGKPLLMRLFKPRVSNNGGPGPFPLMIDLHGGAWCNQDRTSDALFNETLAGSGVVVAALDFRMPPEAMYPTSVADINYATRWLKARAKDLKCRPDKVGYIGISSGGHQGVLAAMRPKDPRYAAQPLEGGAAIDARVQCVVAVWPVIDPLQRFHHAKRMQAAGGTYPAQIDSVIPAHIKYWGDEATMEDGNPVGALERNEAVELPPVLYVQGGKDVVHPRKDLERFVAAYTKRGGMVDLALYEDEGGGFIRDPKSVNAAPALRRIVDFVHRHLD